MNDDQFLAAFESCTWPFDRWHHREHIKAAYLYLCRHPFDTAVEKMSASVKRYNAAHQKQSPSGGAGYHETITQAWMRLVQETLEDFGPRETADNFMDQHAQHLSKDALLRFYSKDRLMSAEARANFVPPDLKPLPEAARRGHAGAQGAGLDSLSHF